MNWLSSNSQKKKKMRSKNTTNKKTSIYHGKRNWRPRKLPSLVKGNTRYVEFCPVFSFVRWCACPHCTQSEIATAKQLEEAFGAIAKQRRLKGKGYFILFSILMNTWCDSVNLFPCRVIAIFELRTSNRHRQVKSTKPIQGVATFVEVHVREFFNTQWLVFSVGRRKPNLCPTATRITLGLSVSKIAATTPLRWDPNRPWWRVDILWSQRRKASTSKRRILLRLWLRVPMLWSGGNVVSYCLPEVLSKTTLVDWAGIARCRKKRWVSLFVFSLFTLFS